MKKLLSFMLVAAVLCTMFSIGAFELETPEIIGAAQAEDATDALPFGATSHISNNVGSAIEGTVFTANIYSAASVSVKDYGNTGLTAEDIAVSSTDISFTAKGYSGEIVLSILDLSTYQTVEEKIYLYGGNKWRPGLNIITGTTEGISFENMDTNDLNKIFAQTASWYVGDNPLVDDMETINWSNSALYGTAAFQYLKILATPNIEENRPTTLTFKHFGDSNTAVLYNDGVSSGAQWTPKNGDEYIWTEKTFALSGTGDLQYVCLAPFGATGGAYGEYYDGVGYTYFDDIAIVPGYRIDYMTADGSAVVASEFVGADKTSYTIAAGYTTSKTEGGNTYTNTGWASNPAAATADTTVSLAYADVKLYPVGWVEATSLSATVGSAKNGAVFTATVNVPATSVELVSAGNTGITSQDVSFDSETKALSFTAKGYAGELVFKLIGDTEETVTVKLYGGDKWVSGVNMLTGTADAFTFENVTNVDLQNSFVYSSSAWNLAADPLRAGSAIYLTQRYQYLDAVVFAEQYDMSERPLLMEYDALASATNLNAHLLLNQGNAGLGIRTTDEEVGKWASRSIVAPANVDGSFGATHLTHISLGTFGLFDYTEYEENGTYLYFDNVSVKPYYRVDYMSADGQSVVASEYVSPKNSVYTVSTEKTAQKFENGSLYQNTGWATEIDGTAASTVALTAGDVKLYPTGWTNTSAGALTGLYGSAKTGAVTSVKVNVPVTSYEITSFGNTQLTDSDVSFDETTSTLNITAKGYAGEIDVKVVSGTTEMTATVRLYGGQKWVAGANILTGTADAFDFENIPNDDLSTIFTSTATWFAGSVEGNTAAYTTGQFAFLHLVDFAEGYDLTRPIQAEFKLYSSGALNSQFLINDSGTYRQGLSLTEDDYNTWKSYTITFPSGNTTADAVTPSCFSIGNFAAGAGDYASGVYTYYDDISIKPYYRVDYMSADGQSVVASEYIAPDNSVYTVSTEKTAQKFENGKLYKSTGWATTQNSEASATVQLTAGDIKLYPAGWTETDESAISGLIGSAKTGAVTSVKINVPVTNYEITNYGNTQLKASDVVFDAATSTLNITSKGYAGMLTLKVVSGAEEINETVYLYGGDRWLPGVNMLTGSSEGFGFDDMDSELIENIISYSSAKWMLCDNPAEGGEGKVLMPPKRWNYISMPLFAEGYDATRPLRIKYDTFGSAGMLVSAVISDAAAHNYTLTEEEAGTWVSKASNVTLDLLDEKGIANGFTKVQLGTFTIGTNEDLSYAPYGDDNTVFIYYDNIAITPYYMITYKSADGSETIATKYALPENGIYTPDAALVQTYGGFTTTVGGAAENAITLTDDTVLYVAVPDTFNGASYREADDVIITEAIRFKATVSVAQKAAALEYGFIIARTSVLESTGLELTFDSGLVANKQYVKGVAYNAADGTNIIYESDANSVTFTGACYNIPENKTAEKLTARSYIKILVDGAEVTLYGNSVSASIDDVKAAAQA